MGREGLNEQNIKLITDNFIFPSVYTMQQIMEKREKDLWFDIEYQNLGNEENDKKSNTKNHE